MGEHTPTPWRTGTQPHTKHVVYAQTATPVADFGPSDNLLPDESRVANAQLATISVNAFAALAAHLKVKPSALEGVDLPEICECLRLATNELNTIRARDGAPQHISWDRGQPHQHDGCSSEWWNELTERCHAALSTLPRPASETEDG